MTLLDAHSVRVTMLANKAHKDRKATGSSLKKLTVEWEGQWIDMARHNV